MIWKINSLKLQKNSLCCNKILRVRGQINKIIKRSFTVFSFKKKSTVINEIFYRRITSHLQ